MQSIRVLGSRMAYREAGDGPPVLLLHGNPTSSFLWRHVLAEASRAGSPASALHWIAPDLIGMGRSDQPDLTYTFGDHAAHVGGFVEALGLGRLTLVGHDWGVALALDWFRRHPDRVAGVAFLEGHLRPLAGWDAFDEGGRTLFQQLRSPGVGERMVLAENFFLDTLLPNALLRPLDDAELAEYRRPYPDERSRRPLLQWAREIPIGGEPADTAARLGAAVDHLLRSEVPKLLLHGQPGVLVPEAVVEWCRQHLTHLTVTDVGGPAGHFLPEDRPGPVVEALTGWAQQLSSTTAEK